MTTRAKAGIFKNKHRPDSAQSIHHTLHAALFGTSVPKGPKTAIKDLLWMEAMQRELDELHKNNTWTFTLVPRPKNHHVVGSKWLFRTKFHVDVTLDRHKARLVARGFS